MYLRLQNSRFHFADVQNLLNLSGCEVGQTDGPYFALLVCPLHQVVSGDIVSGRLMDQQQIDVIGIQPLQCLFHCIRLLIKGWPQLGFQEDFLAGDAGLLNRTAHRFFIHIGISTPLFNLIYF